MTGQKLDAGAAIVKISKTLTDFLADTSLEAELTMAEIGQVVDTWRENTNE